MVRIGSKRLELKEFEGIVRKEEGFELDPYALERVRKNFDFLLRFSKDKVIYGINTGFGPMARYRLEESEIVEAQYNLIRSHAMGSGPPLPSLHVKALILARLNSLMKGYSGISEELVQLLAKLLKEELVPYIPEHGGVGASGDLVQSAHLGLILIGEGELYENGIRRNTSEVFQKKGIQPLKVRCREGLAILNGTSAMTGIGLMNIASSQRALDWCTAFSAMNNELVASYDDHFSEGLNRVKKHEGQQRIAERMRDFLADSGRIRDRSEDLYREGSEKEDPRNKVQEYYSLRCVPQVLGPVIDTHAHAEQVLLDELDSVDDNPIIDHENEEVLHGGNFHGDQVAVEMDKLKMGLTKSSMLIERQLNFLLNDSLNERFPPFLNQGKPGYNFGLQGAQYTATSTVAENQSLSTPVHVHSIPSNKDNQDIVSMGSNAAMSVDRVLKNLYEVLSVMGMATVQTSAFIENSDDLASKSRKALGILKKGSSPFIEDRAMYQELEDLAHLLRKEDPMK